MKKRKKSNPVNSLGQPLGTNKFGPFTWVGTPTTEEYLKKFDKLYEKKFGKMKPKN